MTFADLFNSLLESSRERIKNPLIGSITSCFVIYNWRPISILLFSDQAIEVKIKIINDIYCYPLAILIPILFGVLYTIYLPMLMVSIDEDLEPMKRARIANLYIYKDLTVTKKIDLAEKEYQLKNIETGNKDREMIQKENDHLANENEKLKQELLDSNESRSNFIGDLNTQLKSTNESYQKTIASNTVEFKNLQLVNAKLNSELRKADDIIQVIGQLEKNDIKTLIAIRKQITQQAKSPLYSDYNKFSIRRLLSLELINRDEHSEYSLTPIGINVLTKIDEMNLF